MGAHIVPTNHKIRAFGRPWSRFLKNCDVLKGCVFYDFLATQKVGHKSQILMIWAEKKRLDDLFGGIAGRGGVSGRRKRMGCVVRV